MTQKQQVRNRTANVKLLKTTAQSSWTLVAVLLAGLASSRIGSGCVIVESPISVNRSFSVQVSGIDGPVMGLRLNLTGGGGARTTITNAAGIAYFHEIPPGKRYLKADTDDGYAQLLLDVQSNPASPVLKMQWPSRTPIRVRTLAGRMRGPAVAPGMLDWPALSLELVEGLSGRVLASATTTNRGEFDFGVRTPGIYFIRLRNDWKWGEGLISVAAGAGTDRLDLNLQATSCGLIYSDLSMCPRPDLRVSKLEGRIASDETGGPLRFGAEILLIDAANREAGHASAGPNGEFSMPGASAGAFELRIEGNGLAPMRTPIYIDPSIDPGAGGSFLEVDGAYFGCTKVKVK